MSITSFPYDEPLPEVVTCAFCKREIPLERATIGPINAKGAVSLLCNSHLWDDLKFIDEHADYIASQRRKFFGSDNHNLRRFGV